MIDHIWLSINVVQVGGYPCFGLKRKGVVVNMETWEDDPEPFDNLKDTWIQIKGLHTRWCEWDTLD